MRLKSHIRYSISASQTCIRGRSYGGQEGYLVWDSMIKSVVGKARIYSSIPSSTCTRPPTALRVSTLPTCARISPACNILYRLHVILVVPHPPAGSGIQARRSAAHLSKKAFDALLYFICSYSPCPYPFTRKATHASC